MKIEPAPTTLVNIQPELHGFAGQFSAGVNNVKVRYRGLAENTAQAPRCLRQANTAQIDGHFTVLMSTKKPIASKLQRDNRVVNATFLSEGVIEMCAANWLAKLAAHASATPERWSMRFGARA